MCAGREFQVEGASNARWSGKEICIGRTQESGQKIVRDEFKEVESKRPHCCCHLPNNFDSRWNIP